MGYHPRPLTKADVRFEEAESLLDQMRADAKSEALRFAKHWRERWARHLDKTCSEQTLADCLFDSLFDALDRPDPDDADEPYRSDEDD